MADAAQAAALAQALGLINKAPSAPSGSIADVIGGLGGGAGGLAPLLGQAMADTPISQTSSATSGGATRANFNFGTGDFVINSRSSGSATTGNKSTGQDAGGGNGGSAMPWYAWVAIAAAGLFALVAVWRR